jgi:hypothetical protein
MHKVPNPTDFPPSSTSEAELVLDYLNEESWHSSASLLPLLTEGFDVLDVENSKTGDVVLDREGVEWVWRECFCGHVLCSGRVMRVEGRIELGACDRGRFVGGEE